LVAAYGADGKASPFESSNSANEAFRDVSLAIVRFNRFYREAEDMRHLLHGLHKAGVQEFSPEFGEGHDTAERVGGTALAPLLHGHTFKALCWFPRLNAEFRFDARGDVVWTARHDISDTGSSRIDGNDVCVTLPVITRGREACFAVFKIKGNNHLTKGYDFALAGPSLCYFKENG
jgi:hypothetical protein